MHSSESEGSEEEEEGEVLDEDGDGSPQLVGLQRVGALKRLHPTVQVSHINPDEIPDVPKNRFLYRGQLEGRDGPLNDIGDRTARRDFQRGRDFEYDGRDFGQDGRDFDQHVRGFDRGGRDFVRGGREVDMRGRVRVRSGGRDEAGKKVKGRGAVVSYL